MNSNNNNRHIKVLKWMQQSSTKIIFTIYAALIFFTNVIPAITNQWFEMWVWVLLCVYHLILLISMTYFGITLNSVLKTNITSDLGLRLIGMCVICSVTFLMRSIFEGFLVFRTCHKSVIAPFIAQTSSDIDVSKAGAWNGSFGRDVSGYLLLEWFPAIVVLILMHRSSNDRNSDASHSHGNTVSTATRSRYFQYDDSVNAMEGGELNLSHNPQGINRSHSANGSVPVSISTTRATMTQQQKGTNSSNPAQRTMTTSFGMIRTLSGAAGVIGTGRSETTALLGERSHSAVSGMSNQSYGISQTED